MKRSIQASILLLSLLLSLCACGGTGPQEEEPSVVSSQITEGWIPTRIPSPNWLSRTTGWETAGDTIYLTGLTPEGQLVAASYDTLGDQWKRIDFTVADAYHPELNGLSLAGSSLWGLLHEGPSRDEIARFYAGQLTAEETAAAIQAKARIYVSEQYG